MPELTFYRLHPERTPTPALCMYCGEPATDTRQWRVANARPAAGGGGTDITPVPTGDDPVSGVLALLMLPFILWDLFMTLGAAAVAVFSASRTGPSAAKAPAKVPPRLNPPDTLVTVTVCDRHRRFRARFVWAGLALTAVLGVLWYAAVRVVRAEGESDTALGTVLLLAAVLGTVLLPIALSFWYIFAGPVIVDRVTEDTVVLDRVRTAYFTAAGIKT